MLLTLTKTTAKMAMAMARTTSSRKMMKMSHSKAWYLLLTCSTPTPIEIMCVVWLILFEHGKLTDESMQARLFQESDYLIMKASKHIKADEQIFNDYGPLPR